MTSDGGSTKKLGRGGSNPKGVTRPDPAGVPPEFRPWAELSCRLYDELYATHPDRPGVNELAQATRYAGATISYVFSGRRTYSWQVCRAIVRALGGRPGEWKARWDATARRHRDEAKLRGLLPLPGFDQDGGPDSAPPDRAVGDWRSPGKPPIRRVSRWPARLGAVAFTAALEATLVMLAFTLPAPGSYLAGASAAALAALLGRWWLRRRADATHRQRLKLLRKVRERAGKDAARAEEHLYLIPRFTLLHEEGKKRGSRPELARTDTDVTDIRVLFEQGGDELTLLADAGLGKSAQLAKLATVLAEEAIAELEAEPGFAQRPLPVLLHLATYRGEEFADWIVAEVHRAYDDFPEQLVRGWLAEDLLLPILDGLDHVPAAHRRECAAQIARFRRSAAGLALSCRVRDVQLALTVDTALCAELARPSKTDVQEYLVANPGGLQPVHDALKADTKLWPLLQSPLMLDIIRLTYTGRSADDLRRPGRPAERRERIFDTYVAERLKGHPDPYRALGALTLLARKLGERDEQVLYLDRLNLDWLPPAARRAPRMATTGATTITIWALAICWMAVALRTGAVTGSLPDVALLACATIVVTLCQLLVGERVAEQQGKSRPGVAVAYNIPAILVGGVVLQRIDWGSQAVTLAVLVAAWGYISTLEGSFSTTLQPVERLRRRSSPSRCSCWSPPPPAASTRPPPGSSPASSPACTAWPAPTATAASPWSSTGAYGCRSPGWAACRCATCASWRTPSTASCSTAPAAASPSRTG
ncbi:hypothetical protein Aph01nite_00750 [Acrocarpospora phusangensis]|uniref:NACHT domain-containing protein n=1 Tax=Acrocarpospora phusangensis TaxID=1070424 RepID=A0A919Q6Y3_9ACTN|nr:hypothetical protein [Acrocarpospora phusangensis]GIH21765.1 hypothetical protein Aph01nite_00750 [Acrocarpospora phusangensis]